MKNKPEWASLTVAAILAAGIAAVGTTSAIAEEPAMEKCYGIVKKGMNECAGGNHSCQGTATEDNDPNAWILLPTGTCNKIVGGKLTP